MLPEPVDDRRAKDALPTCPRHLSTDAAEEWHRVAGLLHDMGVLTQVDRAALAAYCQAYGRWVEAEDKLKETPILFKTPSGYVQQSPWLGIANKQLELMGRYMTELGMTPASRSRVAANLSVPGQQPFTIIRRIVSPVPLGHPLTPDSGKPMDIDTWVAKHCRLDEDDA